MPRKFKHTITDFKRITRRRKMGRLLVYTGCLGGVFSMVILLHYVLLTILTHEPVGLLCLLALILSGVMIKSGLRLVHWMY